jgi:hypothetical protein
VIQVVEFKGRTEPVTLVVSLFKHHVVFSFSVITLLLNSFIHTYRVHRSFVVK